MSFPKTASKWRTVFWLVMLIAGFIAGVVLVNFEVVIDGRNPFSVQTDRLAGYDGSRIGVLMALIGFVFVAYVFFGVWVLASIAIYGILSWFDRDLWHYTKRMLNAASTTSSSDTDEPGIDIAWRAILLTYIAGFFGFIAMSVYFGIG